MEIITSSQNSKFKQAFKLHSSRGRQKSGFTLVIGDREVDRGMDAGVDYQWIFTQSVGTPESQAIVKKLQDRSTPCLVLESELFEKLAYGDRSINLIGVARRPETTLQSLPSKQTGSWLILESLEKPGNLGAIARTADAFGISGLILSDCITDLFHPNAIRSSMGAVFSVPVALGSSQDVAAWIREHQVRVFVATPDAQQSLFDVELSRRNAFVLGNESGGVSMFWRNDDSVPFRIPMLGIGDSLNVSVTASVIMYEILRRNPARDP